MAAPNIKEVEWAIQELENEESSESRYLLLSALYTIRDQMNGGRRAYEREYSQAAAPVALPDERLERYGDSDFLRAVSDKSPSAAWSVMDELMGTLQVVNPRVYDGVMRKVRALQGGR